MTRTSALILAAILAAPLAALGADVQVNLGTAVTIDVPVANAQQTPTAFKFGTGQEGWVVKVSTDALGTPSYGTGRVFIGGGLSSSYVYAFNASTGKQDWQIQTKDGGPTSTSEDDGVVVYDTESCSVEAIAADTGKPLWTEIIGDPLYAAPAVADGKVFTVHPFGAAVKNQGQRYKLLCMDLKTGVHSWDVDISADVLAAPVVANGHIYFSCADGQTFCLNEASGSMEWQEKYMGTAAPVVANAQVMMTVQDANGQEGLKRFDAKEGDPKDEQLLTAAKVNSVTFAKQGASPWNYQGPRPVMAGGHVITAEGNTVTSINVDTGKPDWRVLFHSFTAGWNANMFNSPAVGNGKIYLTSTDGHVLCMDQTDGKVLFNYATGQKLATQPILAEGNVYVTTTDGLLICVKTGDKAADGWYAWGGNAAHNKQ